MKKISFALMFILLTVSAHAAGSVVTQSHTSFDVDEITVAKGETVTFANKDDVTHNVQVIDADGNDDDKGLQKPGEDIKANFTAAGEYKVRCAIHPKMKMTVTVK